MRFQKQLYAIVFALLVCILAVPAIAQPDEGGVKAQEGSGKRVNLAVTKVDDETVKPLLVPKGKPLVVNFWATWCEPCREEFPELIEIDRDYAGKIDFIIISLDDPVEINGDVMKFLGDMGSTMTPYLLRTDDESAVIGAISKDWQGGLPFTVVYDAEGNVRHTRQGKIRTPVVRGILDQLTAERGPIKVVELVKVLGGHLPEAEFFYRNNWKALRDEAIKRGVIDSYTWAVADPKEDSEWDIILITRYKSEEQYAASEDNFRKIIKELRPNGPMLVNGLKPEEFRKSAGVRVTREVNSQ